MAEFHAVDTDDGFDILYTSPITQETRVAYRILNHSREEQKLAAKPVVDSLVLLCQHAFEEGVRCGTHCELGFYSNYTNMLQ